MFDQIGRFSRPVGVDWSPAFASLGAAAVTSMVLDDVSAAMRLSPIGAAIASVAVVAAATLMSSIAVQLAFRFFQPSVRADGWAIALRFAAAGVWAGPLALVIGHGRLWPAGVMALLAAVIAQVLGGFEGVILAHADSDQMADGMFSGVDASVMSRQTVTAFSAAAAMELAIALASGRQSGAATLLCGAAGFLTGWATRKRWGETELRLSRRLAGGVILTLAAATALNTVTLVAVRSGWAAVQAADNGDEGGIAPGDKDLYSGVVLLSEPDRPNAIVAPLPEQSKQRARPERDAPLDIPFTGEYWVSPRAPRRTQTALVRPGSPLSYTFSAVDQTPVGMLARQVVDPPLAVRCCKSIDVVVNSTDEQPAALLLELIVVKTRPGSPPQAQSLGFSKLVADTAGRAVLTFPVPSGLVVRDFDEIRIVFHLEAPRAHRSAKVAVVGFHLARR